MVQASAKVETSFTNALYQAEEPKLPDATQSLGDIEAPNRLPETQKLPSSGKEVPQSSPSQVSDDQEYLSPGEHSISSDSEADQEDAQRSNQDLVGALQPDTTGTDPKPSSEFASKAESDIPGPPINEAGTTVDNAKTAEALDAAAVEPSNLSDTVTVAEPEEAHIAAIEATAAAICLPPARLDEHARPENQASPQSRGCENEGHGTAVGDQGMTGLLHCFLQAPQGPPALYSICLALAFGTLQHRPPALLTRIITTMPIKPFPNFLLSYANRFPRRRLSF